jgi:hypothetical protein
VAGLRPDHGVGDFVSQRLVDLPLAEVGHQVARQGDAPAPVIATADPGAGVIEAEHPTVEVLTD